MMIVCCLELGQLNWCEIFKLVGVVLFVCDSGKYWGKWCIQGGCFDVCKILYMVVISVMCYNIIIKEFV